MGDNGNGSVDAKNGDEVIFTNEGEDKIKVKIPKGLVRVEGSRKLEKGETMRCLVKIDPLEYEWEEWPPKDRATVQPMLAGLRDGQINIT